MARWFVLGAGGLGREIAFCGPLDCVFLDDDLALLGRTFDGVKVGGTVTNLAEESYVIAGVGLPAVKVRLVELATARRARFLSVQHQSAVWMSEPQESRVGVFLAAGAVLTVDVQLGSHVAVLNNATVGHDTVVGDYSTICPNASVSGYCRIGSRVFVGAGAVILPHITIGDDAVIGAGAVVTKDVPAGATVVGNPARELVR